MVALPIAAVLTLIFFRSVVAALLPIAIGGFALASCAAIMRLGANFTEIAIFALNVAAFLGLGLSIDYSLLLVQRFREELGRGLSVRDAVATTLDTAGRAVWVSGLAVIVSLAVLIGVPVGILRSVAIGGLLATADRAGRRAAAAARGARLPRAARQPAARSASSPEKTGPSPFWRHVGELSMRHPVLTALGCAAALLAIASPALRMQSVLPDTRIFPHESEVRRVDEALGDAVALRSGRRARRCR